MKCGYIRQTWDCGNTREVEEKHTGRYGARGQKRQKRRKATPEEIAKQNQWKRERDVRRLIKWNFGIGDYWFTLTYKKGSRPPWKQMQKDMSKFIRKLRDKYKKYGWELKYIYRLEIGKNGGPHVHILINRKSNDETDTGLLVETLWEHGHAQTKRVYDVDSGELAQNLSLDEEIKARCPTTKESTRSWMRPNGKTVLCAIMQKTSLIQPVAILSATQ